MNTIFVRRNFLTRASYAMFTAALLAGAPALAQDEEAAEAPETEEPAARGKTLDIVTVTAQKREQSLQDVSAPVTAVSGDRLQAGQIHNIEDLQYIVPSIYLGNDFNMAKLTMRGVGANTSTTGSQTGVALHVDGVFVARAEAQMGSFFDLDRIEVLRGPQGTLYGRNAVGGSINLISAKPTRDFEGYFRGTVGSYESIHAEGAISGPITDTLSARMAIKSENRAGFGINPVTGNDVDDLSRQMARMHVLFEPTDRFDILVTGEYFLQDDASRALKFRRGSYEGGDPYPEPPPPNRLRTPGHGGYAADPRDLASEVDPATETESWSVSGTINFELTDAITLTSITSYREMKGFITQDLDVSGILNSAATTGFNTTVQRRDIDNQQFSTELQAKFESSWLNGVFGFYYFTEEQHPVDTVGLGPVFGQPHILATMAAPPLVIVDGAVIGAPPIDPGFALDLCNTAEFIGGGIADPTIVAPKRVCIKTTLQNDVWAVYGQAVVNLGKIAPALDTVSLKLGGRFSHEDVTSINPSIIFAANGFGPVIITTPDGSANSKDFDAFTPEIGLEWAPRDNLMLYYVYSEGFKAGAGENAVPNTPGPVPPASISTIVDPEDIQNHEAGLKSTWFGNRLLVNLAGFTYKLQGQQINKTIAGGPAGFGTIFENAAETQAKGVELEFTALVTDQLRLTGSVAWLDSEYVDFETKDPLDPRNVNTGSPPADPATDFDPLLPDIQLAGNRTRNSPEWSLNFHAEYDIVGLNLPANGYLTLMGDVSYKSDVFFTEFERLLEGQEAFALLDFNLRFTSGSERFTADFWVKNVTDELVASSTFALATARTIGVTYMPPRVFGFTAGYRF